MKKSNEQIAIESFGGARETNSFFRKIGNEACLGYFTAILLRDNPNSGLGVTEWFDLVRNLMSKGIL
jgi:hypothetical protein